MFFIVAEIIKKYYYNLNLNCRSVYLFFANINNLLE